MATDSQHDTSPIRLNYWHMEWDPRAHIRSELREVVLGLDLGHGTILRLLCSGDEHIRRVAEFYKSLMNTHEKDVSTLLTGFFTHLLSDCQMQSPELSVRPDKRGTELDFPRPSPSRMCVTEFSRLLAQNGALRDLLGPIGLR